MHNLVARNAQYTDGDGKLRSTYETEYGDYKITVRFVIAKAKRSESLAGDGSIRVENTSRVGEAKLVLISAEEGC
jgi:hypothetical protein